MARGKHFFRKKAPKEESGVNRTKKMLKEGVKTGDWNPLRRAAVAGELHGPEHQEPLLGELRKGDPETLRQMSRALSETKISEPVMEELINQLRSTDPETAGNVGSHFFNKNLTENPHFVDGLLESFESRSSEEKANIARALSNTFQHESWGGTRQYQELNEDVVEQRKAAVGTLMSELEGSINKDPVLATELRSSVTKIPKVEFTEEQQRIIERALYPGNPTEIQPEEKPLLKDLMRGKDIAEIAKKISKGNISKPTMNELIKQTLSTDPETAERVGSRFLHENLRMNPHFVEGLLEGFENKSPSEKINITRALSSTFYHERWSASDTRYPKLSDEVIRQRTTAVNTLTRELDTAIDKEPEVAAEICNALAEIPNIQLDAAQQEIVFRGLTHGHDELRRNSTSALRREGVRGTLESAEKVVDVLGKQLLEEKKDGEKMFDLIQVLDGIGRGTESTRGQVVDIIKAKQNELIDENKTEEFPDILSTLKRFRKRWVLGEGE